MSMSKSSGKLERRARAQTSSTTHRKEKGYEARATEKGRKKATEKAEKIRARGREQE
jgi:hypothetical protein